MRTLAAFGLLLVAFGLFLSSPGSGPVPGSELTALESRSISGGQCFYYMMYCIQANTNCSAGMIFVSSTSGSPGTTTSGDVGVCLNALNGSYCCNGGTIACFNP